MLVFFCKRLWAPERNHIAFKMKSSASRVVIIERKQPNDENDAGSTPGEDIQERQQQTLGK